MDSFLLRVMQRQLHDQCVFLLMAADRINEGLKIQNMNEVFFSLQNLLNAGANIRKCFGAKKEGLQSGANCFAIALAFQTPHLSAR